MKFKLISGSGWQKMEERQNEPRCTIRVGASCRRFIEVYPMYRTQRSLVIRSARKEAVRGTSSRLAHRPILYSFADLAPTKETRLVSTRLAATAAMPLSSKKPLGFRVGVRGANINERAANAKSA